MFEPSSERQLATKSSPILACCSLACSSSIFGAFLPPRSNAPDAPSSSARFQHCITVGRTPNWLDVPDTVQWAFKASGASYALNSGLRFFRFDISDLLSSESQQTENQPPELCPTFRKKLRGPKTSRQRPLPKRHQMKPLRLHVSSASGRLL